MDGGDDGTARRPVGDTGQRSAWRRLLPVAVLVALVVVALAGRALLTTPGDSAGAGGGRTPDPNRTTAPTTLAIVTDFGNCDAGEVQVAAMVDAWAPDAIATAGDNTQTVERCVPYTDSVDDYYREYTRDPAGPRFWPVLGNHDYGNEGAGLAPYQRYFHYLSTEADPQRRWYDQQVSSIRLFMLDSEAPDADLAAQRAWLKGALAAARAERPATWNIVMFHRPAYSSGTHGQFAPMSTAAGWDYRAWGADLVVAGHQHIYEDVLVDGLHHVTAGVGASDIARPCPATTTRVPGSRLCVEGPGALRLTATPAALVLEHLQPAAGGAAPTDVITLRR